ncbi:MAG: phosphoribosylglycinamide formyltransferase [Treponema sp.]|nr:phosphoribosylglycinamide formyltransferase [Treponema sp.]
MNNAPLNILVLVSGNGSNLQALLDAGIKIAAVLSDRPGAYALERARAAGIPALTEIPAKGLAGDERRLELSGRILRHCRERQIGLVVLAGFLSVLSGDIIEEYSGRMINLHPALLPKFGGQGMYGENVHRAVLAAGESESGCTVHLVDSGLDTGRILLQRKVPVLGGDTPESLAERIHREEHIAIVEAVKMMLEGLKMEET